MATEQGKEKSTARRSGPFFYSGLVLTLTALLAALTTLTRFLGLLTGLILPLLATLSWLVALLILLTLIILVGHCVSFPVGEEKPIIDRLFCSADMD